MAIAFAARNELDNILIAKNYDKIPAIIEKILDKPINERTLVEVLDSAYKLGGNSSAIIIALYLIKYYLKPKGPIDINATTKFYAMTALHEAVQIPYSENVLELIRQLIIAGANPMLKDYQGKTPYEVAFDSGNIETAMFLRQSDIYTKQQIKNIEASIPEGEILKNIAIKGKRINEKNVYNILNTNKKKQYTNKQLNFIRKHIKAAPVKLPHVSNPFIPSATPISNFTIEQIKTVGTVAGNKGNFKLKDETMPVITIPKGSLLFNSYMAPGFDDISVKYNTAATSKNIIDFLAGLFPMKTNINITDDHIEIESCLDHLSQKFFYTNPVGGIALSKDAFNVTAAFETKRDIRLAVLMSPGPHHRLVSDHTELMPCDKMPTSQCACAIEGNGVDKKCNYGYQYDVCIHPEFLQENNLDGHVAIAAGDTYENHMYKFDSKFMRDNISEKYSVPHRLFFDYCRSVDERGPSDKVTGFPEIVLHMFGTGWYKKTEKIQNKVKIPLPKSRNTIDWIAKLLLEYNHSLYDTIGMGFQSDIKLIRLATEKYYFNFETGVVRHAIETMDRTAIKQYREYGMYLNFLDAYNDGDLDWLIDPRTGFLLRVGHLPVVIFDDGEEVPFEELCIVGTDELVDKTLFYRSAKSRELHAFWKKEDCLPFIKGSVENYKKILNREPYQNYGGGRRKTYKKGKGYKRTKTYYRRK
jgi:hypothetical protein